MKAVVFHGVGDIRLDDVPEPTMQAGTDAIIRVTACSICGTDLHLVRGTIPGMRKGTILGHEAVGMVEAVGPAVRTVKPGDRVVVCSTIACGECIYCRSQEFACCQRANPNGPEAGTAYFGGPEMAGNFNGLQAEFARIPFADTVLVPLPDSVTDRDALLLSDILPTGYLGAEMADVIPGDIVAVFGCGPVGQMAIASAQLMGASQVVGVDALPDRLDMARKQGAMAINYEEDDPVKVLKELSSGYGPDSCIDAVGLDAQKPHAGPAKKEPLTDQIEHLIEQKMVAPFTVLAGDQWRQGDAPSQALQWCLQSVRKSGVLSIIGLYSQAFLLFPIGFAMQKALTVRAANCSHRKYVPELLSLIETSELQLSDIFTKLEPFSDVIDCYRHFDKREPGWLKVDLVPEGGSLAA
jgi:threonine dehydrogenase-like Zn-dependent dehydrogenase